MTLILLSADAYEAKSFHKLVTKKCKSINRECLKANVIPKINKSHIPKAFADISGWKLRIRTIGKRKVRSFILNSKYPYELNRPSSGSSLKRDFKNSLAEYLENSEYGCRFPHKSEYFDKLLSLNLTKARKHCHQSPLEKKLYHQSTKLYLGATTGTGTGASSFGHIYLRIKNEDLKLDNIIEFTANIYTLEKNPKKAQQIHLSYAGHDNKEQSPFSSLKNKVYSLVASVSDKEHNGFVLYALKGIFGSYFTQISAKKESHFREGYEGEGRKFKEVEINLESIKRRRFIQTLSWAIESFNDFSAKSEWMYRFISTNCSSVVRDMLLLSSSNFIGRNQSIVKPQSVMESLIDEEIVKKENSYKNMKVSKSPIADKKTLNLDQIISFTTQLNKKQLSGKDISKEIESFQVLLSNTLRHSNLKLAKYASKLAKWWIKNRHLPPTFFTSYDIEERSLALSKIIREGFKKESSRFIFTRINILKDTKTRSDFYNNETLLKLDIMVGYFMENIDFDIDEFSTKALEYFWDENESTETLNLNGAKIAKEDRSALCNYLSISLKNNFKCTVIRARELFAANGLLDEDKPLNNLFHDLFYSTSNTNIDGLNEFKLSSSQDNEDINEILTYLVKVSQFINENNI